MPLTWPRTCLACRLSRRLACSTSGCVAALPLAKFAIFCVYLRSSSWLAFVELSFLPLFPLICFGRRRITKERQLRRRCDRISRALLPPFPLSLLPLFLLLTFCPQAGRASDVWAQVLIGAGAGTPVSAVPSLFVPCMRSALLFDSPPAFDPSCCDCSACWTQSRGSAWMNVSSLEMLRWNLLLYYLECPRAGKFYCVGSESSVYRLFVLRELQPEVPWYFKNDCSQTVYSV